MFKEFNMTPYILPLTQSLHLTPCTLRFTIYGGGYD